MSDERLRKAFSDAVKGQIKNDIEFLDRKTDEMNRVSDQKFRSFTTQLKCLQLQVDSLFSKIRTLESPEPQSPAKVFVLEKVPEVQEESLIEASNETPKPELKEVRGKMSRTVVVDRRNESSQQFQNTCTTCSSTKDQQVLCDHCGSVFCEGCVREVVSKDTYDHLFVCRDCEHYVSKNVCEWIENPKAKIFDMVFKCQSCNRSVTYEALGFKCINKDHFASFCVSCCHIPSVVHQIIQCRARSH